jgi:hypothetical protein
MNFEHLVVAVLCENNVAGGPSSVYGPNVVNTATSVSGDNYAPNDSRVMKSLYSGVLTRFSNIRKKSNKKKKKSNKRKK